MEAYPPNSPLPLRYLSLPHLCGALGAAPPPLWGDCLQLLYRAVEMNNREWAERVTVLHQLEPLEECKQLLDYEEMVDGFEKLLDEYEAEVRRESAKTILESSFCCSGFGTPNSLLQRHREYLAKLIAPSTNVR